MGQQGTKCVNNRRDNTAENPEVDSRKTYINRMDLKPVQKGAAQLR
jgi:hypothetical protein